MTHWVGLCVTLLLSTATDSLHVSSRSSIVGGNDAPPGRWPWMVYLPMTDGKSNTSCGGTLISDQWVMTAAHCVNNRHVKSVVVGRLKLREDTEGWEYPVRRVVPCLQYDPLTLRNDMALIQLDKPVSSHVKPVPLPTPTDVFNTNSKCWVTGWGKVSDNEKLGGEQTLQEVQIPILDDTICRKIYPGTTRSQLCAGDLDGGKGTCNGDSGGPLVCEWAGRFIQVGVVSFAEKGCAMPGNPTVYTRVLSHIQFIDRVIRQYS